MVRDFDNNLREYIDNLMNEAMNKLRSENYAFMELEAHERDLYKIVEKITDQLPGRDRKTLRNYFELSGQVKGQESEFMYYQGMKDVVRFLKFFGVL